MDRHENRQQNPQPEKNRKFCMRARYAGFSGIAALNRSSVPRPDGADIQAHPPKSTTTPPGCYQTWACCANSQQSVLPRLSSPHPPGAAPPGSQSGTLCLEQGISRGAILLRGAHISRFTGWDGLRFAKTWQGASCLCGVNATRLSHGFWESSFISGRKSPGECCCDPAFMSFVALAAADNSSNGLGGSPGTGRLLPRNRRSKLEFQQQLGHGRSDRGVARSRSQRAGPCGRAASGLQQPPRFVILNFTSRRLQPPGRFREARGKGGGLYGRAQKQNEWHTTESGIPPSYSDKRRYTRIHVELRPQSSTPIGRFTPCTAS